MQAGRKETNEKAQALAEKAQALYDAEKQKLEEAQKRIEDLETDKEVLVEVNQNIFRMLQEERKNAE